MTVKLHLDALLLSLASSTDNFTVGFSVGLSGQKLPFWANVFIAVFNAGGALVASWGGASLGKAVPSLAPLLASVAFGYLGIKEFFVYRSEQRAKQNGDREMDKKKDDDVNIQIIESAQVLRLALPMTLNNLAGGVAGGAAGLFPITAAIYALAASLVTMEVGHVLGNRLGQRLPFNPTLLAALLLGALCLLTLQEGVEAT